MLFTKHVEGSPCRENDLSDYLRSFCEMYKGMGFVHEPFLASEVALTRTE